MNSWLRRLRGALGIGLMWGAAGFMGGMLIELVHNVWPNALGAAIDIWPAALAYPGVLGGIAFSVVLGVAGRDRRFDELSLGRFALWGAVGGLMVALVPAMAVLTGLASTSVPLLQISLALAGPFAIGGAMAAAGSLALARLGEDRELLEAGEDVAEVGLTPDEARELLG